MAVLLLFEAVSFSLVPALVFQFPAGRNQDAPLTQLRHIKGLFFHRGADSSTVSSESSGETANHGPACAETLLPKVERKKKRKEKKNHLEGPERSTARPQGGPETRMGSVLRADGWSSKENPEAASVNGPIGLIRHLHP